MEETHHAGCGSGAALRQRLDDLYRHASARRVRLPDSGLLVEPVGGEALRLATHHVRAPLDLTPDDAGVLYRMLGEWLEGRQ